MALINRFNISQGDYELLATDLGIDFILGAGVDMNNDVPRGRDNLLEIRPIPTTEDVPSNEWRQSDVDYIESSRTEDYYRALSINIKASYGPASARANYNRVTQERQQYHMVIVLITDRSTTVPSLDTRKPIEEPSCEKSTENVEKRTWQFLQDYGSHYINKISFGYQIAFEAKVSTSQFSDETSFSASLAGAYGSFSGAGGVNMAEVAKLKSKGVIINGRITSGGISPDRPLTIGGPEDLTSLLQGLADGSKTIKRGPLKLYLQSYWHVLKDYPKTRAILEPDFHPKVSADFGVPVGTIVAYYPPVDIKVAELLEKDSFYWVPEGWALCNGYNGTPNLTNLFIMGSDPAEIGISGGSVQHQHRLEAVGYDLVPDASNVPNGVIIHPAEHLPPFIKMTYIIRK